MSRASSKLPRALTVAGSDSGGGAGIQADLKTFFALGVFGAAAVTAVTAQDDRRVVGIEPVDPKLVADQMRCALAGPGVDAAKTGMLCRAATVSAVAGVLREARLANLVVDPVFVSTSGTRLLGEGGLDVLRDELLPLARIVTPNLAEAAALTGIEVGDLAGAEAAAREIVRAGAGAAVVTGGHLAGDPVDVLFDGREARRLAGRRIGGDAHGTGCVFSAAIAARLACGAELAGAVSGAKRFVEQALEDAVSGRGSLFFPGAARSRAPSR